MNSTTSSAGFLGSDNISSFRYGIGISVGILLLITTITLASYFCTRVQTTSPPNSVPQWMILRGEPPDPNHIVLEMGLDEETLLSYPKLLYSEAKINKDSTATCCSICLGDYKGRDMPRLLPDCGHLFHLKCVDPWLRLHPTSGLQNAHLWNISEFLLFLSTPLAEVVPLSASRDIG